MVLVKRLGRLITLLAKFFLPLFTDKNQKGETKVSIGRAPLLVVLVTMCIYYIKTGVGPDTGTLTFIGMAMAYNGFSKTKSAQNEQKYED